MGIISDGITPIDLGFTDEVYDPNLEESTRQSTGGRTKRQVSGERLQITVRAAVTQTLLRSVLTLLNNSSSSYFYTPTDQLTDLYPSITYPLEVNITNIESTFDNKNIFYVKFDVVSVDYL